MNATKVELRGPAPYGGTYYSVVSDPAVRRLQAEGWRVVRVWYPVRPVSRCIPSRNPKVYGTNHRLDDVAGVGR